jgi:hypothetical protein
MDDNALSLANMKGVIQALKRRKADRRNCARMPEVELARNARDLFVRDHDVLGVKITFRVVSV